MNRLVLIGLCLSFSGSAALLSGCEPGGAEIDEGNTLPDGGRAPDGGPGPGACKAIAEVCDGLDNDCDGQIDEGVDTNGDGAIDVSFDVDGDGVTTCGGDCDDTLAIVHPGASELKNGLDDNCDGKVDNNAPGFDYDKDGTAFPEDCNDDEPLVSPLAVEVGGDSVDNNCNGQVDEPLPNCESSISAVPNAGDYARAIGLCSGVTSASFPYADGSQTSLRNKFGSDWLPKQGSKLVLFSTGKAVDRFDEPAYNPQPGYQYNRNQPHPLYTVPACAAPSSTPDAKDLLEFKLQIKVPANAKSFTFNFNFFSAEYPEYVCTQYNDRFIAVLTSQALPSNKPQDFVAATCPLAGETGCRTGNVSFDKLGQPVTINNGFFDVCEGPGCTKPVTMLNKTGYEDVQEDAFGDFAVVGGATGWLTTTAPVKPGETVLLRFIIFDEGDHKLDSAVLIDNFKWEAAAVTAPSTDPVLQ